MHVVSMVSHLVSIIPLHNTMAIDVARRSATFDAPIHYGFSNVAVSYESLAAVFLYDRPTKLLQQIAKIVSFTQYVIK